MIGYLVASILLLIAFLLLATKTPVASPAFLFAAEWGLICLLASMRLFTLYEASTKTWVIILIGSIFMLLGVAFGRRIKMYGSGIQVENYTDEMVESHFMCTRTFWILLIFITAVCLVYLARNIPYLQMGYTIGDLRSADAGQIVVDGYTTSSGALSEYFDLAVSVIEVFVVASGIQYFISNPMQYKWMMVGVLIYELVHSLETGGRFNLAYLILEVLVCYSLYRALQGEVNFQLSDTLKKRIRWIVILLIAAIIVITLMRGAETTELIKKYYRYICGDVVFFDLHVEQLDQNGFWSCTFGAFYGFWSLLLPILNRFGVPYPQIYLDTIEKVMNGQTFLSIGDDLVTNAFITSFYHLYADFRWIGVIVGMFLFGCVAGYFYQRVFYRKDAESIVYYLIIAQMLFKTLQMYPTSSQIYVLIFIVMIFRKIRIRN